MYGGRPGHDLGRLRASRHGLLRGAFNGDDAQPVEDTSIPPAGSRSRHSPVGHRRDSGGAAQGAIVAFGGHTTVPGTTWTRPSPTGAYSISSIFFATYPKVSARAPGSTPWRSTP